MNKNNELRKKQMLIFTICFFYALGIGIGILYNDFFSVFDFIDFSYPEITNLKTSFIHYGKFILPMAILGFFSLGIFFIIPWVFICGNFYGYTSYFFIAENNFISFLFNALYLSFFTIGVILTAISSISFSFSKYKNYSDPKKKLPREKNKLIMEYISILLLSNLLIFITSYCKLLTIK